MRRSAAPSRRGFQPPLKRPRVDENDPRIEPLRTGNSPALPLPKSDTDFMAELGITLSQDYSQSDSRPMSQESDGLEQGVKENLPNPANGVENRTVQRMKFKPVFQRDTNKAPAYGIGRAPMVEKTTDDANSEDSGPKPSYYSVMWCKLSKKKHKKWEGDAVLTTRGRSVILQDMEGKDIGRSSGYKLTELATLTEGQTLGVGGKEIEVMGVISEADYKSGKCFTSAASVTTCAEVMPSKPVVAAKPFVRPQKDKTIDSMPSRPVVSVQPRHDPTHPDAVVMPRPPHRLLRESGHDASSVVDVVLDPYLTHHLRPHQRTGVRFLYECVTGMRDFTGNGAILADEMGLGKTLQCITLIWTLLKQGPYGGRPLVKRIIVVTPGSLVKNWKSEFRKWLGDERISVYAVGQDRTIDDYLLTKRHPVLVISYEMFVKLHGSLKELRFDLVICDEGHRLKNSTIKTTSLLSSLSCRRRVVLTGTPVQNDLQEFFSLVEFCNPGVLGTSASFNRVYGAPILASRQPQASPDDVSLGEARGVELARLTDLFILRRTSDINNDYLPPKTEFVLFCQPSQLQLVLYRCLLNSRMFRECLSSATDTGPLTCIDALKKLCNHPVLLYNKAEDDGGPVGEELESSVYRDLLTLYPDDFKRDWQPAQSGKLIVLDRLLDEIRQAGERVVLVSNYTKTLDIIQKVCQENDLKILRLDGQTPTTKRQELVQRFNSRHSDIDAFLLSSKAGGTGLNLIGASRLVLYDMDWNPATDLQAMARVWRDGQRRHVRIYRLITTGTIEEKIYQRQIAKQGLSGAVVGKEGSKNNHFSQEDLKDLFTLREDILCDTHDLLACSCHGDGLKPIAEVQGCHGNQLPPANRHSNKKNLSMVELLSWQHADNQHLDEVLDNPEAFRDHVTYAFWNETNLRTNDNIDHL